MANIGDLLIAEARKHLGKPYVWATHGPDTFDCSGFTYYVTKQVQPNFVIYQGTESQRYLGTVVPLSSARPGDFVFFVDPVGSTNVVHVDFYVSPTEMIHAQNESTGVILNNGISGSWFAERLYQVRRLFPYDDAQAGGTTPPPPTGGSSYQTGDLIQVTDGPLNVRSGPSTSHSIVTTANTGAQLCVTGASTLAGGYEWVPIKFSGGTTTGYVVKQFTALVTVGGCVAAPPPPPPPAPTGKFAVNDKAYCTSGPLNVRSSASTGANVLGTVPNGADVCVLGGPTDANGYRWWNIKYGTLSGWSVENFLALRTAQGCAAAPPPPTTTWTHKVTGGTLNMRTGAGTWYPIITTLPLGTRLRILGGPSYASGYTWYNVEAEGKGTGWIVNGFDPI